MPVKRVLGRRGRHLPPYYSQVVDEKQREEISKIQDEYEPKIEDLQKQIDALKKERDEKIAAVLTPEQKKQVEEARTKAKTNRKSKGSSPVKPAEETPVKPAEETPPAAPTTPAPKKKCAENVCERAQLARGEWVAGAQNAFLRNRVRNRPPHDTGSRRSVVEADVANDPRSTANTAVPAEFAG